MALRQRERRVARDRAEHRNADRRDRVGYQSTMALAADAIEHHARDAHRGIMRRKPAHHGGRRLRLAGDIDHQQHRQAEARREISRRAATARRTVDAIEQPHDAFDDQQRFIAGSRERLRRVGGERIQQCGRHRPAVEIDASPAGRRRMERCVDIIGTRLRGGNRDAASLQRGEEAKRHRGLARSGPRRRNHEAARGHRRPRPRNAS